MSKVQVKVGKKPMAGASERAQPAREPKPIHPGLQLATSPDSYRCLRCGTYFSLFDKKLEFCSCGLWVRLSLSHCLRFIRFSSMDYLPGQGEVFSVHK